MAAIVDPEGFVDCASGFTGAAQSGLEAELAESLAFLEGALGGRSPRIGIILGSGLGVLADHVEDAVRISFADIPNLRSCTAAGHAGILVAGTLSNVPVLVCQGRLHGYEGATAQQVAFPVWLMARLGVEILITTNAAGALNPDYRVGDFCIMTDHLNFTGRNPLVGTEPNRIAPRFVSMYEAYDPKLRLLACSVAAERGIAVREGVYAAVLGPSFETPAEVSALRVLGADTVAMSVVEEVIAARHMGMRVLGISLVSNLACGIEESSPDDDEVRAVGAARSADFVSLVEGIVFLLPGA